MPGRQDFAIIRSRFFADGRLHTAAELYVKVGIAAQETAVAAVVGHIAMLGAWAVVNTDDGVLRGHPEAVISVATNSPAETAKKMCACLLEADLLREHHDDGSDDCRRDGKRYRNLYLVGFGECYRPVIARRKANAASVQKHRKRRVESSGKQSPSVEPTQAQRVVVAPRVEKSKNVAPSVACNDDGHGEVMLHRTGGTGPTGPSTSGSERTNGRAPVGTGSLPRHITQAPKSQQRILDEIAAAEALDVLADDDLRKVADDPAESDARRHVAQTLLGLRSRKGGA